MPDIFKKYSLHISAVSVGVILALVSHSSDLNKTHLNEALLSVETEHLEGAPLAYRVDINTSKGFKTEAVHRHACNKKCEAIQTVLSSDGVLEDEGYEKLLGDIQGLSAFLRDNVQVQNKLIVIAISTQDGNKQDLIVEAFKGLPKKQSEDFAFDLFETDSWDLRAKGTELLEGHHEISEANVERYFKKIEGEENQYVKQRLIQTLVHSESLAKYDGLVPILNSTMQYSTHASVRSTALNSKMELTDDKNALIGDALYALRSGQEDFQISGLSVYETLLTEAQSEKGTTQSINKRDILEELEKVFVSTHHVSAEDYPQALIDEAYNVYNRHADEN